MVKTQLDVKVKVSIYRSSFVPTLTSDHELWVVTRIIRLKIQAAEINFLQNVLGSPSDCVRSMVVQEGHSRATPPLNQAKPFQMDEASGISMCPGCLLGEEFWACPGGGPRDDLAHAGEIISLHWLILCSF